MANRMQKRALVSASVAVLASLCASTASAQMAPHDEDLPTPLAEREDEQQVVKKQPARTGPRPSDPSVGFDWPDITPSATISAHLNFTDESIQKPGFGLWLGANYYPWPDEFNAFWSFGLKIENNPDVWGRPTDLIPTLRSGFAWLDGSPTKFKNQLLPNLQIYALTGYRIPRNDRGQRVRAGLGVSSPRLSPATAVMLLYGFPLPNQLELLVDVNPIDPTQRDMIVLVGIGL